MPRARGITIACLVLLTGAALLQTGCQKTEYLRRTDSTNTLYVGVVESSFPVAFMPWLSRDGIAPTIASMLYSTLFSYDDETGGFLPGLARDWCYVDAQGAPIVTESGGIDYARVETEGVKVLRNPQTGKNERYLTVRIELDPHARWSDGHPVTAEDVYYTFDIARNNYLSNHAGALAWTADLLHLYSNTGQLQLQGVFTYNHGAADLGYPIAEAERDLVVYVHVRGVLGAVTSLFTTILILPHHLWEPVVSRQNQLNSRSPDAHMQHLYQNPVGSGPYVLDAAASGPSQIVLRRNELYHQTREDSSPLYTVETLRLVLYQEINVAIYAVMQGHIDMLSAGLSPNYVKLFEGRDDLFLSIAEGVFTQTLVFNVNPVASEQTPLRRLLSDARVRRAIALAIDTDMLIRLVANGAATRMSAGLIAESLTDFCNPSADILHGEHAARLEEANDLLDQVAPQRDAQGYRLLEGERVTFNVLGHPGEMELVAFLEIQLQKIGIKIRYQAKGNSPETTHLWTSRFDMTLHGVIFSLANVDIMLNAHFVALGRTSNYGRLIEPELAAAIEEMRSTLNLHRKFALLYDLQPVIAGLFYKVPLYTPQIISIARTDRYTGYEVVPGEVVFNSTNLQRIQRVESPGDAEPSADDGAVSRCEPGERQ
ncbi:MAG: ABC transporter substrate-binding protein [Candidatus Bipolaricaulota bacterium]